MTHDSFNFSIGRRSLSGLLSRVVDMHLFSGIRVRSLDLIVTHLQYMDETIILAYASIENLWSIKDILIEVNFDHVFLHLACDFLHCKQESLSFNYLGIFVGDYPCLSST